MRLVFSPVWGDLKPQGEKYLVYAQRFDIEKRPRQKGPDELTGMWPLLRCRRSDSTRVGGVVPLKSIRCAIDVEPNIPPPGQIDETWNQYTSLERAKKFWMNKWDCMDLVWAMDGKWADARN